ncbi:unnamed protein product [Vicia faba]|uniref:Uncharacterized protein n=1 Tax=Vicia faba TaxID=3906 RepID=A0AAV0ZQL0_VICFA|nr:unnamed protein product [Vicia faba]
MPLPRNDMQHCVAAPRITLNLSVDTHLKFVTILTIHLHTRKPPQVSPNADETHSDTHSISTAQAASQRPLARHKQPPISSIKTPRRTSSSCRPLHRAATTNRARAPPCTCSDGPFTKPLHQNRNPSLNVVDFGMKRLVESGVIRRKRDYVFLCFTFY